MKGENIINTKSTLYLVATPIGNLKDFSYRGVEILNQVDIVLAESTKKTRILFDKFNIKNKISLFNDFSSKKKIDSLVKNILSGQNIALVSDAGTPLISDPGSELIKAVLKENIRVVPVPGPSSPISALVASGLSTEKFSFHGFLPKKQGALKSFLKEINLDSKTQIFFESPKRIKKTLLTFQQLIDHDRKIVIARELTKIYEEFYRGKISDLKKIIDEVPEIEKGELVLLLEGSKDKFLIDTHLERILFNELKPFLSLRQISKIISKISSKDSKEIYNIFKKK
ncbi:MAG: 16S rRNA (cytidine(1402)-2'-O)-methyltransferase [Pseudomonadota bacterium]|nr:16S rRNA (cytidine(1402)-2'-O)-methyltransferase [Pseudomonadota bacterium]